MTRQQTTGVRTRVRIAALALGAVAAVGASAASPAAQAGALKNGTQLTGVRGRNEAVTYNGTQLTGVREPRPAGAATRLRRVLLAIVGAK
jgi:hypothetical protein